MYHWQDVVAAVKCIDASCDSLQDLQFLLSLFTVLDKTDSHMATVLLADSVCSHSALNVLMSR